MNKVYEKPLHHEEGTRHAGNAQRIILTAGVIGATLLQTNPNFCEKAISFVAGEVSVCPEDATDKYVYSDNVIQRSLTEESNETVQKMKKYKSDVDKVNSWRSEVEKHATDAVDPEFVMILLDLESKGDPDAVSHVGAEGLLQIMPTTAPDIAERLGVDSYDMFDPETNIQFATEHIRWLIEDVEVAKDAGDKWPLYVAASYNFGHGAAGIISSGNFDELPEETRNYALNAQQLYEQLAS